MVFTNTSVGHRPTVCQVNSYGCEGYALPNIVLLVMMKFNARSVTDKYSITIRDLPRYPKYAD